MCGIAGLLSNTNPVTAKLVQSMTERIQPRGPDSSGEWIGDNGHLGFGHRRLAIIDLSEAGAQPMHSASGRYTVSYNGEIYNFEDLRAELAAAGHAPVWKGHSDTEVMLAAFDAWGLQAGVRRLSGMFALAVWDHRDRTLTLARDRFGEKPLYYGWTAAGFAFASTLGAIKATPGFHNPVDPAAVACLMARGNVPAPLSIYRRIFKLPPGCILTLPADADLKPEDEPCPAVERWFDYAEQVLAGAADPISDQNEALEALDSILTKAVGRQLVADVPVGNFLSGGIDSSLITAIAQKCVNRPIKTFTIGFLEAGFDEAFYARQVATALGTDHTELYLSAQDAVDVIPSLPAIYDEPFADSSQIPTYLVSRMARQQVSVSLSGDGGDELFGGYNRHIEFPRMWRRMERVPGPLRKAILGGAGAVPSQVWNGLARLAGGKSPWFGDKVKRGLSLMARADHFDQLFDGFLDTWSLSGSPMARSSDRAIPLVLDPRLAALPLEVQMMHADAVSYLPDDILAKVDRAGMAVSLESRIPFLDPEVTALACRIAPSLKFASGGGKDLLKQLLYRYIPRPLVDRPKAGFSVPVGLWLRGPLRDWAEDLLSESALSDEGLFDPGTIRQRWQAHLTGREDATEALWPVLMYQSWRAS
jgi:asparagine synthase (glutamine-hydrolysing)